jgi:hypothetical protein
MGLRLAAINFFVRIQAIPAIIEKFFKGKTAGLVE